MMTPEPLDHAVELYLAYFHEAKALHEQELGMPLEMYKDTEPLCVERVFTRLTGSPATGSPFLSEILHELAWAQCLGNANHRTAVLFAVDLVEWSTEQSAFADRMASQTDDWVVRSQAIIRRRGEWGYNQAGLEERHRAATSSWIDRTLGQSEALMMIGPRRLLAFLSGNRSSNRRLD